MTYQEELVFGLIRWMIKGTRYLQKYDDENKLIADELTFDALSYVVLMVSDIAKRVLDEDDIIDKYPGIDFEDLSLLKNKIFINDNVDYSLMFDEVKDEFPLIISNLVANK